MRKLFAMVVHAQPKSGGTRTGGSTTVGTATNQSGQSAPIRRVRVQRGRGNTGTNSGRTRGNG